MSDDASTKCVGDDVFGDKRFNMNAPTMKLGTLLDGIPTHKSMQLPSESDQEVATCACSNLRRFPAFATSVALKYSVSLRENLPEHVILSYKMHDREYNGFPCIRPHSIVELLEKM